MLLHIIYYKHIMSNVYDQKIHNLLFKVYIVKS